MALLFAVSCAQEAPAPDVGDSADSLKDSSGESFRGSVSATLNQGIAAVERGEYTRFPALVNLALEIKNPEEYGFALELIPLEEKDFDKVLDLLGAAREKKPRYSHGGKVATFTLPGFGLKGDKLLMINHLGKWYFATE